MTRCMYDGVAGFSRRTRALHLTGPALQLFETTHSFQPARQVNAVVRQPASVTSTDVCNAYPNRGLSVDFQIRQSPLEFLNAGVGGLRIKKRQHLKFRQSFEMDQPRIGYPSLVEAEPFEFA
jgi:hypothetical protein